MAGWKKLVLLDAHAIIHRAYHALPKFVSSRGAPTGGLYGLSTMLIRLLADLRPDYLAACYDLPEETFRKQIYESYKTGRPKADEELVLQLGRSRDIFAVFNIPMYSEPGFEADDVIGTIVEQGKNLPRLQVIIASGDMDTLQLVSGDKVVVYTLKKGFSETVLYDDEAVVRRFGFAPPLLADFKGLAGDPSDNIVGVPGIGEKTAGQLVSHFGSLEKIYQLLKESRQTLLEAGIKERVLKLLAAGEEEAFFSKTLATIRKDVPITFTLPPRPWREGLDFSKIETLFKELDFRTLAERVKNALLGGEKIETKTPTEISPELKIAAWLLNSELSNPTPQEILELAQTNSLAEAPRILEAEIKKQNLGRVYREIELPLIPIIARAEERGILIDLDYLGELSARYRTRLEILARRVFKLIGERFNLNSPKQLAAVLFDKLHLSPKGLRQTPGGARSTRESELLKLKDKHPAVGMILEYRELQKLLSTYLDAIPPLVDKNHRLHTKLNQTGTATGRMSSTSPNLQNVPIVGDGRVIRKAFVATPGFVWLAFDYSQIEMRVLALLSGDEGLQKIFKSGQDVHSGVAMKVFGVLEKDVAVEMRRRAKVINFGIIYGMGVNALRANLNSTREEAQSFLDDYFVTFPKIHDYFEATKTQAKKLGYTTTYFGRRRYLPGLHSPLSALKAASERMALNAPIQGTAADIIKLAMIRVDERLKQEGLAGRVFLLLPVHDELIYEVAEGALSAAASLIKTAMEEVMKDPVPFTVTVASGPNWAETHLLG